ncbi:uncharacterized protein LTR77_003772 [Saxophila tyrrhenica]|uniref:OPA3-like protein n=1 Tax=Saxophila tyrrhenica TaxID=1690608 RepID=A0AAV9PIV7_9PEZI|nr:hypothetical protein LTR77_003772 [Saxophila tyrrhenica]
MSLTFKLLSLGIRTVAKPIGNYIKRQAKEHEGFRRFAIGSAQRVHRIDMRLRLGLLHDPEAQQRMHDREQRAAEEKKKKAETPTVRTADEQKKYDEQQARDEKDRADKEPKKEKEKAQKIKIRPLSDARAIELGANFFSETFIFGVAVTLLLLENYRNSRNRSQRRDEVEERLDALEAQVETLQKQHHLPELEALNEKIKKSREARNKTSWYNPAGWWRRTDPDLPDDEDDEGIPGEVEHAQGGKIPGNVPGSSSQAIKVDSQASKAAVAKASGDGDAKGTAAPAPARVDSVTATKKER